jgi:hypothetical protein
VLLTIALGGTQDANAAEGPTGMRPQQWCSNPKEGSLDRLSCTMFTLGFVNGLHTADGFTDPRLQVWCLPSDLTAGQTELIANKFMGEHPEDLHRGASAVIARALYIAYACKRNEGGGEQTQ